MKKLILATLSLLIIGNLQAKEYQILSVTNDDKPDRFVLSIETDKSDKEIVYMHKYAYSTTKSKPVKTTINIREIIYQKKDKIVLETEGSYEVVNLRTSNFALHNGGDLTVDTLHNAVKNSRKSYELELSREGDNWVVKQNGETIKTMHFITNKVPLIGTVGISKMIVN